jgi:hypothetical protein
MADAKTTKSDVKKVNKFVEMISANGSDVLKRRATAIGTSAQIAQETIVNDLKNKISNLELKLIDLTDLAPETSDSLRPGSKSFDPNRWVTEVQNTKQDLYQLKIQLKLAEETYNEYFVVE